MTFFLEFAGPWTWEAKRTVHGPVHRVIWGWFSLGWINMSLPKFLDAIKEAVEARSREERTQPHE